MRGVSPTGPFCFLVSPTTQPCGIEMFERELARSLAAQGADTRCVTLGGTGRDIAALWPALGKAQALAVSLPVVAWKRVFLSPLVALALARLRGVRTAVVLHEWADLNPLRRAVMSLYVAFAQSILVSSPSVAREFGTSAAARLVARPRLMPIPPNIALPPVPVPGALSRQLMEKRRDGSLVIGQFGSIYPKKQSTFVLDVAASLRRRGVDASVVFVGGFIKGHDDVEERFWNRARQLGLEGHVTVTGYVDTDAEIFALFETIDVFVYAFREGLTSRRGSVLACLQTGRPVVVNAPAQAGEFDHHPTFRRVMDLGLVHAVPTAADAEAYADAIVRLDLRARAPLPDIFDQAWSDAAHALIAALCEEKAKPAAVTRIASAEEPA